MMLSAIQYAMMVFSKTKGLVDILKDMESALISYDIYTGNSSLTLSTNSVNIPTVSSIHSKRQSRVINPGSQLPVRSILSNSGPAIRQHITTFEKTFNYAPTFTNGNLNSSLLDSVQILITNLESSYGRLSIDLDALKSKFQALSNNETMKPSISLDNVLSMVSTIAKQIWDLISENVKISGEDLTKDIQGIELLMENFALSGNMVAEAWDIKFDGFRSSRELNLKAWESDITWDGATPEVDCELKLSEAGRQQ
ncbi:hypothetical protein HK096_011275, partial [Nowakowskiella sp. JEL0078]